MPGAKMNATKRTKPTIALLIMTFLWGWTFVWIKDALDVADARLGGDALTLTV
jgi:4-hydroxybenzoate polyprenyltransferase